MVSGMSQEVITVTNLLGNVPSKKLGKPTLCSRERGALTPVQLFPTSAEFLWPLS